MKKLISNIQYHQKFIDTDTGLITYFLIDQSRPLVNTLDFATNTKTVRLRYCTKGLNSRKSAHIHLKTNTKLKSYCHGKGCGGGKSRW